MSNRIKNKVVTISFLFVIIIVLIANLMKENTKISLSERRKLQQFPELSIKNLFNNSFSEKFDKYAMDQFIQRENVRSMKANVEINVFKKQDSNNIYEYERYLIEQIYPLNEKSINNMVKKINEINEKYLDETNNVYYSIIPDKNYFVMDNHLKLDYKKMQDMMNLEWAEYINIFDCLDLSCYYKTDSHWKQECLQKVICKMATQMNLTLNNNYEEKKIVDFRGVYSGQLPIKVETDEIRILTNDMLSKCTVYNYEKNKTAEIYDLEKKNSADKYDIYLSGATPLLTIENPNVAQDKELIVFRDSYGSSLVPLLVEGYDKITVIDTRYISPKILVDYVEFNNKDVLFIYSTLLINNSFSLK